MLVRILGHAHSVRSLICLMCEFSSAFYLILVSIQGFLMDEE